MTFKGILDVFIYHILRLKYTLNLSYNMYVSSFKPLFTYPFFGSADCLLYYTVSHYRSVCLSVAITVVLYCTVLVVV